MFTLDHRRAGCLCITRPPCHKYDLSVGQRAQLRVSPDRTIGVSHGTRSKTNGDARAPFGVERQVLAPCQRLGLVVVVVTSRRGFLCCVLWNHYGIKQMLMLS